MSLGKAFSERLVLQSSEMLAESLFYLLDFGVLENEWIE